MDPSLEVGAQLAQHVLDSLDHLLEQCCLGEVGPESVLDLPASHRIEGERADHARTDSEIHRPRAPVAVAPMWWVGAGPVELSGP